MTSDVDWPTYNGDPRGNRYTTLTQINKETVIRLAPQWIFSDTRRGAAAGDADRRRRHHVRHGAERAVRPRRRKRPPDLALQAAPHQGRTQGYANRGAGVAGRSRLHGHRSRAPVALNRFTGRAPWDTELADWRKNYAASSAPLPAGDLVVSGVSGGEHGANGFVAAYDQATGKEVWRFWTVPKRGEPGSETWQGKDIEHGGAPTWFTGSYDPALDIVYWPTGNPAKEYNGDDARGQPLRELDPRARSEDREAAAVLPVHAARPLGLGCHADIRARGCRLGGPAAAS